MSAWYGILGPAGTPRAIVQRVHQEVTKALGAADIQERLAADGSEAVGSTPEAFGRFIREEMKKWRTVVKAAGATVD